MVEINQKDKETTINQIYVSLPLLILRYSIFAILAGVAGFLGFLTYSKLNATQLMDFQNFYTTAVSNVEGNLQESLQRQLVATSLMRNIFGTAIAGGYAGSLPNVTLPGFDVIMNDIGTLAGLGAITFSPLVTNSTRHQWEAYAISHASLLNSTDPEDTWKVTDGIGNISAVPYIYNSGLNSNSPEPSWLFPYWQVTSPYYENMIMLDPRSGSSNVRTAINHVITSKQSALSDVEKMFTLEDAQNARPSSILFSAINGFEAGNPIIGLFSAQFFWDEIIQVSQGEQLMDCVITTPTEVFTLRLDETGASLSGWSDLHDPCFDQYEISYNDNNLAFLAMFPGTGYTISFYPTKQFYKKYITSNPLNACLLAICLVIVPVLLQLVYMCLSKKFERKLENERNANVTQEVARGAVLKAKKVYVRYISHEMRTPLNAAHLGLKILEKDLSRGCGPENEDHLLIVREIGAACETAVTILNDLLNYDKLEDHMMIIERKTLAARSFLMDSIPVLAPQAKEKGVKILYDLDDRSVQSLYSGNVLPKGREEIDGMRHLSAEDYINVDENKMHQVIRNMVSNAIKFTPPGKSITIRARKRFNPAALVGITNILPQDTSKDLPSVFDFYSKSKSVKPPLVNRDLEMTVSTVSDSSEEDYGCLVLDVIDLGVGMKLEESSRLFKEVIQFNPGELQAGGGSGLGMMITKGIVDLHAGDIRVYSEGTGMGCTFTLILPLSKPPSAAPAVMATHRSSTRLFGSSTYSDPVPPPRPPSPASVLFDEESAFSSAEVNTATASSDLDSCGPTVNFYQRTAAYRRTLDALPLDNGVKIGQGSSAVTRRLQVLVVDDSALNRKMLVRLLKAENICCDEADDGVVAVKMTAERYRLSLENPVRTVDCETGVGEGKDDGQTLMYDAILMDFMMPNMDGPTATREIRAMGYEGVILGVTGNALPSDIDHFVRKGADRVLTKPVDIRELKSALGCIGGLLH